MSAGPRPRPGSGGTRRVASADRSAQASRAGRLLVEKPFEKIEKGLQSGRRVRLARIGGDDGTAGARNIVEQDHEPARSYALVGHVVRQARNAEAARHRLVKSDAVVGLEISTDLDPVIALRAGEAPFAGALVRVVHEAVEARQIARRLRSPRGLDIGGGRAD